MGQDGTDSHSVGLNCPSKLARTHHTSFSSSPMPSSLPFTALRLFTPKLSPNTRFLPLLKTPPSLLFPSSTISVDRLPSPIRAQNHPHPPPPPPAVAGSDPSLLPPALRDIVSLFQSVPGPKAKYHQLLHYSRQLPPLDPRYKTDEHRVRGCVSQVWVRAFPDPQDPGAVRFEADSDSALTKGLAALLVFGLSGSPPLTVARVPPEFAHLLGLGQSLTPSRNNGFLNMLRLMQQKALMLSADGGSGIDAPSSESGKDGILEDGATISGVNGRGGSVTGNLLQPKDASLNGANGKLEVKEDALETDGEVPSSLGGGRAGRIREILDRELAPSELVIDDISHLHAGHAGVRGSSGGETHFNLRVVSKEFEGKSLVKRHRLVYGLLQKELQSGLHALSIDAKAPSEV